MVSEAYLFFNTGRNNIETFDFIHAYSKSFHENACYV